MLFAEALVLFLSYHHLSFADVKISNYTNTACSNSVAFLINTKHNHHRVVVARQSILYRQKLFTGTFRKLSVPDVTETWCRCRIRPSFLASRMT